jgi:hypothetical protein
MIKKKVYGLVAILSLSFAGVAMAASSAPYSGEFVSTVTTVNSIDVTGNNMTITHTQSNTAGRTVAIKAQRKGTFGYSTEKTVANISSNVSGKVISATGLTNGNYKLQFVETSGVNPNNGYIKVSGSFKD